MVEGVGVWYLYEITLWLHTGNLIAVNNIIVKKLSLKVSLIAVNVIDYHFHSLQ